MPSLNDVIAANRANRFYGAKFKKDIETAIGESIRQALTSGSLHRPEKPVIVYFEWHEKTKRRDADNIASSKKFILDALVKNDVLIDDNRNYVKGFYDVILDDNKDFVVVELKEV